MDCSPPGSSVHGILQARTPEWVAIHSYRGFSQSRDRARVSYVCCTGSLVLLEITEIQTETFIAGNLYGDDFEYG